jgi:hypothetical protein
VAGLNHQTRAAIALVLVDGGKRDGHADPFQGAAIDLDSKEHNASTQEPWDVAEALQPPLPDDMLEIVMWLRQGRQDRSMPKFVDRTFRGFGPPHAS